MNLTFEEEPSKVPITNGQSILVAPMQPWPSAYRGSRYSLVSDNDSGEDVLLKWQHRDLSIFADTPDDLWHAMDRAGKSSGYGSFRVTARGEVITKVKADAYSHTEQAPISEGWILVYLGQLSGKIDFGSVETDPEPPTDDVSIWPGLPFKHGERWSVNHEGALIWSWRDYRFESAFDHPELTAKYAEYRPNPGRFYITEHGHIWANVPHTDVVPDKRTEVRDAITSWKQDAESRGDTSTLRLVNRRLVATSSSDDPADGHLPIHLGHLRDFDGGVVPRPVVSDNAYYVEVAQYEHVYE